MPKEFWKRPAVIGVSVVGVIGVLVLFISLMSLGDAEPVAWNTPPVVTSPIIPSTRTEHPPTLPPQPEPESELEIGSEPEPLRESKPALTSPHVVPVSAIPAQVEVEKLIAHPLTLQAVTAFTKFKSAVDKMLPNYLQGSTTWVYAKQPRTSELNGVLRFTVKQTGRLYLIADWQYQGRRSGDWVKEQLTRKQLVEEGWEDLGSTPWDEEVYVFTKIVQKDEQYSIRTNKYWPPYLVIKQANALPASLQEGLVAYYPFNGNVKDESGNGNDGEVHGATATIDRFGNPARAYFFDGVKAFVDLGDRDVFDFGTSDFSLSLWVKTDGVQRNNYLLAKYSLPSLPAYGIGFGLNTESYVFIGDGLDGLASEGRGTSSLDDGQWHHFAVSFDRDEVLNILIDGKNSFDTNISINRGDISNSINLLIGKMDSTYYSGAIDDIRIYNRALSEAEVKAFYDFESKPPNQPIPTAPAIESTTNTFGMTFNKIPAGTFMMGSPEGEEGRRDNETQHKVTISKAFYMQTTEVTQGQWKAVMATEPWKGQSLVKEGPNYAATYVNWDDAVAYCKKLSEKEGKTYRLPTEAEWEYACRAGTETRWSFGDDEKALGDYAWYRENAYDIDEEYAHQVELKKPNAFGLYDMHGNVYEWCHDYYGVYKQSPAQDPPGPARGSFRVLRGGSWNENSRCRSSAFRLSREAYHRYFSIGFRVVRELD
jgi:formylglycine-generating enzyme required for sulfatase activity